ncbi:MAG TPA: ABC transporter ATP-binding protein [Novosphingobium capsulatum]|nr:ABC transporter ATP-binding protein [Novosphingobium aromaticivorans]HIQ17441.1 ABC transporter ATP-binding protein [Novosphingobium capsulatum]
MTESLDTKPLVEIENLTVRFADSGPPRVNAISLVIHRGECVALVGESGSGKSVTARTIIGLSGPGAQVSASRLRFDGQDIRHLGKAPWGRLRGGRIGFVMQDALGSLDPLRTVGAEVGETLRLHTPLDRKARAARVIELLRAVGVPEPELRVRQRPGQLSGGQRQRALIASAIAADPDLLIADEPTTALDAAVQAQVVRLLETLRRPDRSMLIVSHDLAVVARLADRIAVMQQGRIVEEGPADRILAQPIHPYTRELLAAARTIHASHALAAPPPEAVAQPVPPAPERPAAAVPVLEGRDLAKAFVGPDARRRAAVAGISFHLHAGETLGIVGESGSGKTTLTRLILGLEQPDSGSVLWRGQDFAALPQAQRRVERRRVQVVFQDPLASFDPRYTVRRVLDEALAVAGEDTAGGRAARQLLQWVQLPPDVLDRRPIELSGGQRQRVAIARALAPRPEVLVCDEPVSALDVYVQAQILDLLADLKARLGIACLFISHDLGVIRRISDRVLVMQAGEVVEHGPVETVFAAPRHPYTRALIEAILPVEARAVSRERAPIDA